MRSFYRFLAAALFSVLLLAGCRFEASSGDKDKDEPSLRAQVGQMVMVGFRGLRVGPEDPIWEDIRERNLGGVVLYSSDQPSGFTMARNIESPTQLQALTAELRSIRDDPLLIGIDQEGGRIQRLTPSRGFQGSPSHQALGDADDLQATYDAARALARQLRDMGINLNFAPVVDVNINPDNPAIGRLERAFSADPAVVTRHARAYIQAHRDEGVLTTLKHFPGHGSAFNDSHEGVTDITSTWLPLELDPYRDLIGEGAAELVMTAHVFHAGFDTQDPATLSPAVITGRLRDELGFQGVVVSDDLQMGAIVNYYGFEATLEKTILAGVDLLIISNNASASTGPAYDDGVAARAIDHIVGLVEKGVISRERIRQSYQRIQDLKRRIAANEEN